MNLLDPKGWPICAICQRPVDRVMSRRHPQRRSIVIVVECHGRYEESELSVAAIEDANSIEIRTAFADGHGEVLVPEPDSFGPSIVQRFLRERGMI